MKTKLKCILAATILSASTSSIAKDISYDYIQGTYALLTINHSEGDIDGNTFGANGSISVAPNIALSASLGVTSYDEFRGIDVDSRALSFGVKGHISVAEGTDIQGGFSVAKLNIESSNGFDSNDTGKAISIGLRSLVGDAVELEVGYARADAFDETTNAFNVGARVYANDRLSLGIGYSTTDADVDVNSFSINARVNFK